MAQFRLSSQIIGRSAGRSVVAAAAYRAGASYSDERTGQLHDFTRRRGVIHTEILAPENTPAWMLDRARLWNAVEAAEKRKDAQLAREIQLSLPFELTGEQRRDLVRRFAEDQFTRRGMIADIALHAPGKEGDDRNHHAHIMLTMRELAGNGFGKKARDWNSPDVLQGWREAWADAQNRMLAVHGHEARVDHRSLEAQGIDREPTGHLGQAANDMERRKKPSRIVDENQAIDERNNAREENRRQAVAALLEIERLKAEEVHQLGERQASLASLHRLSTAQLEERQHRQLAELQERISSQYGEHRRQLDAASKSIESRLQATGFRRVLRDILGRTASDQERLKGINTTLDDIARHEQAAIQALAREQEQQRRTHQAKQQAQREQMAVVTAAAFEPYRREALRKAKEASGGAGISETKDAKAVRLATQLASAARAPRTNDGGTGKNATLPSQEQKTGAARYGSKKGRGHEWEP